LVFSTGRRKKRSANERLALLMELRQFRQQHPEQFPPHQGLPLRARVGAPTPVAPAPP